MLSFFLCLLIILQLNTKENDKESNVMEAVELLLWLVNGQNTPLHNGRASKQMVVVDVENWTPTPPTTTVKKGPVYF